LANYIERAVYWMAKSSQRSILRIPKKENKDYPYFRGSLPRKMKFYLLNKEEKH